MIVIADSNIFYSALIAPNGEIANILRDKINDEYLQEAFTIVKDIDEDDYPFIALHLQIKHKIWSRDQVLINGLTAKGYGHFFITTEQVKKHLYKKRQ